jgi:hypothetical protein
MLERSAWQRKQSDYQPAAGGEGAADVLQRAIHDLGVVFALAFGLTSLFGAMSIQVERKEASY